MSEEEKKETGTAEPKEGLGPITRREFAIGSVAMIGAKTASVSAQSASAPPFKLEKTEEVRAILDERHIIDDDLIEVIKNAESTGEKLYKENSKIFLSKLRINEVYFYAEYSPIEGGYRIHSAYTHRFTLEEG